MKLLNILVLCLAVYLANEFFNYEYNRVEHLAEYNSSGYEKMSDLERDLRCLSDNLYMESGTESIDGMLAVAQVTMNRVHSGIYPNTVCGVVYQNRQFSWTIDSPQNKHNYEHKNMKQYNKAYEVSKKVLIEKFTLPSLQNALYYHADYVNPDWAKNKKVVLKIGKHIFYE